MVLNHASLVPPDRGTAVHWLKDMTVGMSLLVQVKVAEASLRMSHYPQETRCLADWSLHDAYQALRQAGARDEYQFLMRLSAKVPLLADLDQEDVDRFLRYEEKSLPSPDGEPLIFCVITDNISVGFPSDSAWDKHQVTVTFNKMTSDTSILEATELIDNLTRSGHAPPICDRHRDRFRSDLSEFRSGEALWDAREAAFPNLLFGLDVQHHLDRLNQGHLGTVIAKLALLDDSAAQWRAVGGTMPPWKCYVRPESEAVVSQPKLRDERRFRSHDGTPRDFMWHAGFGSGRIHFRFDPRLKEVEIGYIGPHLPTKRFD